MSLQCENGSLVGAQWRAEAAEARLRTAAALALGSPNKYSWCDGGRGDWEEEGVGGVERVSFFLRWRIPYVGHFSPVLQGSAPREISRNPNLITDRSLIRWSR